MNYEAVIYEKEGGIATLTFNRPQVMNAGNFQLYRETRAAVEEARNDNEVRVLIVTGAGRGFHAGDDVKELFLGEAVNNEQREKHSVEARVDRLKGTFRPIAMYFDEFYKPTIAAVNGPAVGAGLGIAISCDVRIASENAKFSYMYVRRCVIDGGAVATMMLKNIIGLSRALEMMLSGEIVDAAEAERVGLVSKVVPQDRLMEEAREMALKLMKGAPLSQQAIKRCVHKAMFDPAGLAQFQTIIQQALRETEDHLEGARAFAEKRDPVYKGR